MAATDQLSRSFAALADPTRRAILERLAAGDAGVVELAKASTLTQPAITKHLKVLERAGLIGRVRDGQRDFSPMAWPQWTTGSAVRTQSGPTASTGSKPILPPKPNQPLMRRSPM